MDENNHFGCSIPYVSPYPLFKTLQPYILYLIKLSAILETLHHIACRVLKLPFRSRQIRFVGL